MVAERVHKKKKKKITLCSKIVGAILFLLKLLFACYSAWLEESDDEVVTIVNRRIGAVTGLDMTTAEPLQVDAASDFAG